MIKKYLIEYKKQTNYVVYDQAIHQQKEEPKVTKPE